MDKRSFWDAMQECESLGAKLPSIHSRQETIFIMGNKRQELYILDFSPKKYTSYHQGLFDSNDTDFWLGLNHNTQAWFDETPMDYTNWAPGEPNHINSPDYCVHWLVDANVTCSVRKFPSQCKVDLNARLGRQLVLC